VAGQFRVEPAGLTGAGGRLAGCADTLGGVDLSGPLSAAAGALPASSTAGAAGELAGELTGTVRSLSSAVTAMSATALTAAGNYSGADSSISQLFRSAAPLSGPPRYGGLSRGGPVLGPPVPSGPAFGLPSPGGS